MYILAAPMEKGQEPEIKKVYDSAKYLEGINA